MFEQENAEMKITEMRGEIYFQYQVEGDIRERMKPRESVSGHRSIFQEKWKEQRRNI